jgi:hypothetical protein
MCAHLAGSALICDVFHNVAGAQRPAGFPENISALLHRLNMKLRSASRFQYFCGAFTESV